MAMDSTEAVRAEQMRELARQYCDGAFNKGEYRRRRRSILQQWVENDFEALPVPETAELPPATMARPRDWLPIIMVTATLMVAAMMGFVIYTLR